MNTTKVFTSMEELQNLLHDSDSKKTAVILPGKGDFPKQQKVFIEKFSLISQKKLPLEVIPVQGSLHVFFKNPFDNPEDVSEELNKVGLDVLLSQESINLYHELQAYTNPLDIPGLALKRGQEKSSLFPYQTLALNLALERKKAGDPFYFFNMGTGTGKSVVAAAGSQYLINQGEVDLVLFFTLRTVKPEIRRLYETSTTLSPCIPDRDKATRRRFYDLNEHFNVYILNYEKARRSVDFELLKNLIEGKRVLFVLDEVQKVVNGNQAREGLQSLFKACTPVIWPMTASVVGNSAERYFKVFQWSKKNPFGTLKDFRKDYLDHVEKRTYKVRLRTGRIIEQENRKYIYSLDKVRLAPRRVLPYSLAIRKSDPGVREYFKEMSFQAIPLQLSKEDRELYDYLEDLWLEDDRRYDGKSVRTLEFFRLLRYSCLTGESLLKTTSELALELPPKLLKKLSASTSTKLERVLDDVESIVEGGDKVIVFTHWTNLSLKIISREMKSRGIIHALHYGGQTTLQNEEAKKKFKTTSECNVLLSSDAGSHGMNMPEARVVINFDCPYDYDTLMQRNDRIDRADTFLDGLESRLYYYEDTVEEYIWGVNNERRLLSSSLQGTQESFSRSSSMTEEAFGLDFLKELKKKKLFKKSKEDKA